MSAVAKTYTMNDSEVIRQLSQEVLTLRSLLDDAYSDKKAGFDVVFAEMNDDPDDPFDRKWSTICIHIRWLNDQITFLNGCLEQQASEIYG